MYSMMMMMFWLELVTGVSIVVFAFRRMFVVYHPKQRNTLNIILRPICSAFDPFIASLEILYVGRKC